MFTKAFTHQPVNWSSRSRLPTHKDAMETGIAYIRHNYPELVKDAVREVMEGVKYRNKQKTAEQGSEP